MSYQEIRMKRRENTDVLCNLVLDSLLYPFKLLNDGIYSSWKFDLIMVSWIYPERYLEAAQPFSFVQNSVLGVQIFF